MFKKCFDVGSWSYKFKIVIFEIVARQRSVYIHTGMEPMVPPLQKRSVYICWAVKTLEIGIWELYKERFPCTTTTKT